MKYKIVSDCSDCGMDTTLFIDESKKRTPIIEVSCAYCGKGITRLRIVKEEKELPEKRLLDAMMHRNPILYKDDDPDKERYEDEQVKWIQ